MSSFRRFRSRKKGSYRSHGTNKQKRDLYDWLMFGVAVLGVIGVVATIWIGRRDQASNGKDVRDGIDRMTAIAVAMRREQPLLEQQANAMAKVARANDRSAAEIARQVVIAGEQTEIARGASIDASRPWVSAVSAQFEPPDAEHPKESFARVSVMNSGNSPATNLRFSYEVGIINADSPIGMPVVTNLPNTCGQPDISRFGTLLYPKASMPSWILIPIPGHLLGKVTKESGKDLIVRGCFKYPVGGRERRTGYCFILAGRHSNYDKGAALCSDGNFAN